MEDDKFLKCASVSIKCQCHMFKRDQMWVKLRDLLGINLEKSVLYTFTGRLLFCMLSLGVTWKERLALSKGSQVDKPVKSPAVFLLETRL